MALEAKNITCSFGMGKKKHVVVDQISFFVEPGEMVALVGRKRSGKSTLLNVFSGLNRADSGQYFVDGRRLRGGALFRGSRLRHTKLGMVTKAPMLISEYTVLENTMLPLHHRFFLSNKKKQRMAKEALRAVGLKGKGRYYPHELSVLEQQLVCTARAIVHHPVYLLADEPTACLEGEDAERYLGLMEVLCSAGYGILIATYSKRVAGHCDRIVPITGEQIPDSVPVNLTSQTEVEAVPGHTLAGTKPLRIPEEALRETENQASAEPLSDEAQPARRSSSSSGNDLPASALNGETEAYLTGEPVEEKDALQAILDEQAEISAAEERMAREAYEKDEIQEISFSEDIDSEFEQKLGSHIEDYMQEEKKGT